MAISEEIGRPPDMLVTNKLEIPEKLNEFIKQHGTCISHIPKKPNSQDYRWAIDHIGILKGISEEFKRVDVINQTLLTLNGYLRIVPADICSEYYILNGHPGDIISKPELKGKDPQKRAWEAGHKVVGSVIHRCIPEVDAGEIVARKIFEHSASTEDELIGQLHNNSVELWSEHLKMIL